MASPLRLAARARTVQWRVVLGVAMRLAREGQRRWGRLTPREQRELRRIVRKAAARRGSGVTPGERAELRRIVWKAVGPHGA